MNPGCWKPAGGGLRSVFQDASVTKVVDVPSENMMRTVATKPAGPPMLFAEMANTLLPEGRRAAVNPVARCQALPVPIVLPLTYRVKLSSLSKDIIVKTRLEWEGMIHTR